MIYMRWFIILLFIAAVSCNNKSDIEINRDKLRSGDIIFQTSLSEQSKAIQAATGSKYSHMGIIYKIESRYYVYEASGLVRLTKLSDWIARGENGEYVVKRLKNADKILTPEIMEKMDKVGRKLFNKKYDKFFDWSDDKIYCSELVWKIYKRGANIEIGKLQELSELNLSDDLVKQKVRERFKTEDILNEKVITPEAIFNSSNLTTVAQKEAISYQDSRGSNR